MDPLKHKLSIILIGIIALASVRNPVQCQESVLKIQISAKQVSLDPFTNVYLLTDNKELRKYNQSGELENTYSDLELSEYSEISSDNPFKAMVYYPEYSLIRVFGNKLQILAELDLTIYGLGEITAVAPVAGLQSFWVFDATNQKLIRINQEYKIVDAGNNLTPIIGEPIFPTIIKERESWVYVYDRTKGLYIFDNFGAFKKKLDLPESESFSVFKGRIFYISSGQLFEMDPFSNTPKPLKIQVEGNILGMTFRQMIVENNGVIEVLRF